MLAFADVTAQTGTVSVNIQNGTVKELFSSIEKQTPYRFSYREIEVDDNQNISINVTNQNLKNLLEQELTKLGLTYRVTDKKIIITPKQDQAKIGMLSGKVIDSKGECVIGATIMEKGTTNGTITDFDGNFMLNASKSNMLQISYVGYKTQTVKATPGKAITITLKEDTELLDEVVVVGYGTMKKKDLMGAASMVSGNDLATNSSISVGGALQGKMSGINILSSSGFPGAETSINIRGIGTFGDGNNSPLVVIDGIPVDNGFETLNPSDIESVNVLKDASSAAIYGSRAANGVILVTTKKGAAGKAKVSVNATWGMQKPSHMMDLLNADEFVSAIQEMRDNKQKIDGGNPSTKYDGVSPSQFGKGTNWGDYIYDSAPTLNINANVSGGNENMNYYFSGEFLDQDGIAINTGYKKAGLRSNLEAKVNERLRIGNNVNMTYRYTEGSDGIRYSDVIFNAPITPAYDEDGTYGEPDKTYTGSKNAIAEVAWKTPKNNNYRLMDNLFVEFKFTDYLKFRFNGGFDMIYNEYKLFEPKFNDGGVTSSKNKLNEKTYKNFMWVTDYLLYFNKKFGKHTIDAMGGFSQQLFTVKDFDGTKRDYVSEVENMQIFGGSTNNTDIYLNGGNKELALASWFGRVNYDFNGRYLFSFNLRADGSSRFKSGNQWGVFPSVSGAWRISEEEFFNVPAISNLKLRASWGKLGNQSIGSWYPTVSALNKVNTVLGPAADNQILYAGYVQNKLGNNDLKWETTTVTNLGLDLGFFNSKLYINTDFYIKDTDGILRSMVLPPSIGMSAPNMNYAQVRNTGVDLEIGYNGDVRDFRYHIAGNFSFTHNEIKRLSSGVDEEISSLSYGGLSINRVGEPVDALYGYRTDGVITTAEEADRYKAMGQGNAKIGRLKYRDANGDGKITGDDRVILGSYIPKVSVGLTLGADWKGFDLNMVFSGVFGRKQHSPMSFQNRQPDRNLSRHWYENRYILGEDPAGKYPAIIQGENYEEMTDLMVTNSSFFKMKSLTLGYTFNFKPIRARLFLSGENLFTIHSKDFDGFDPENGNSVGHYTNWGGDFPTPRILLIGTNLTF